MDQPVFSQGARLADKVAVITGSGRGIGRAMAQLFAAQGAAVVVVDVVEQRAHQTLELINDRGDCMAAVCDISDSGKVQHLFDAVRRRYGRVDVLVNVAGIAGQGKRLSQIDDALWQRMLDINLSGTFYCTRAAALAMLEQELPGSIISISSTGALSGESAVHYDTAKGALLSMTRSLARELGSRAIRVNAICPGPTNTELLEGLGAEQLQALTRRIPMKRMAEPGDIAGAALFLASDEAAFVTGQTLLVNGGSWFL
ncbi:MAG: glucose 1-dehydrogenase [Halioglobus sp.]|nr:glucose 1-dehydrogenase [Halioglobus sp.]